LPTWLAALSGFRGAMLVSDRGSTNGSLEIDRQFPRVVVRNAPRTRRRVWSPPSGG